MRERVGASAVLVVVFVALLGAVSPASAVDVGPTSAFFPELDRAPAERLATTMAAEPVATLSRASVGAADDLAAIKKWNQEVGEPMKNGFSRSLAVPRRVDLNRSLLEQRSGRSAGGVFARSGEDLIWSAQVEVEAAYRLRLHLDDVNLPEGTRLWVYGAEPQDEMDFGLEVLRPEGDIWTPSAQGPMVALEVRIPGAAIQGDTDFGFTLDRIAQIFPLDRDGSPLDKPLKRGEQCLQDAACFGNGTLANLDFYKDAIAHLQYMVGASSYICSGGLMNDTISSHTPYLYTAAHCFNTQSSASTLEAYFDYIAPTCLGTWPSLGSLPRVVGSTLLATRSSYDSTLVRLSANPSGFHVFMGWTSATVGSGANLYRLHHPKGYAMSYSRSQSHSPPVSQTCSGWPTSDRIYQRPQFGGIQGGSSGSLVFSSDGKVRGVLTGTCGPAGADGCDYRADQVDGRLSMFYPYAKPWLNPSTTDVCVEDANTLCLNNDRFRVRVTWRDFSSNTGSGKKVSLTADDSGLFYFFTSDNIEQLVKVLDGCSINNQYWVFAAATTNVEYTLTVTDTLRGVTRTYFNPLGNAAAAITDTLAFSTCP